jgi:hypothetical protein
VCVSAYIQQVEFIGLAYTVIGLRGLSPRKMICDCLTHCRAGRLRNKRITRNRDVVLRHPTS